MQTGNDRPLDIWSDDELLDQHGKLTREIASKAGADDLSQNAKTDALIQIAKIREEIQRRGLNSEDESTSFTASTVRWDGDGAGIDPSSGAVPPA